MPVIVKDPILVRIVKEGEKKQIYKNAPVVMTCTLDTKVNKLHGKLETIGDLPSLNSTARPQSILNLHRMKKFDKGKTIIKIVSQEFNSDKSIVLFSRK